MSATGQTRTQAASWRGRTIESAPVVGRGFDPLKGTEAFCDPLMRKIKSAGRRSTESTTSDGRPDHLNGRPHHLNGARVRDAAGRRGC